MKWAVYWEPDDIEISWFKTESEARAEVQRLIKASEDASDEGVVPHWEITLLEVRGLVRESPDGLHLSERV